MKMTSPTPTLLPPGVRKKRRPFPPREREKSSNASPKVWRGKISPLLEKGIRGI